MQNVFFYCYDRLSKTLQKRAQKTARNSVRWVSIKLLSTRVRRIPGKWRPRRRTKIATQCYSKKYKLLRSCCCFLLRIYFLVLLFGRHFFFSSDTFCMATAFAKWTEASNKKKLYKKQRKGKYKKGKVKRDTPTSANALFFIPVQICTH